MVPNESPLSPPKLSPESLGGRTERHPAMIREHARVLIRRLDPGAHKHLNVQAGAGHAGALTAVDDVV